MGSGNQTLKATRGDCTAADLDMPYGVAATQALIDEKGIDVNAVAKPAEKQPLQSCDAYPSSRTATRRRERMKAGFAVVAALGLAYVLAK